MRDMIGKQKHPWMRQLALVGVTAVLLVLPCPALLSAEVALGREKQTLTADLRGVPLGDALKLVGERMGWNVFVEPGLETRRVSTRFTDLTVGESLRRIMGELNYALIRGSGENVSKLLVYATSASSATQEIELSEQVVIFYSKRIDNEIIVQIKPGSTMTIEDIAKALDAEIVGEVEGLNAYRLRFKDKASADIARERLKESDTLQISDNHEWGRPGDNQPFLQGAGTGFSLKPGKTDGNEIIVGLIDMPVQAGEGSLSEFLLPGITIGDGTAAPSDLPSHGTSMAQTVLKGVELGNEGQSETSVRILPIDVYGGSETTSTFQVAAGIYEAVKAGASIVNLSLGGTDAAPFMEQMISEASRQGVLFVGAAGNSPGTDYTFPAAYPDVLAVTAAGRNGEPAAYANTGDFVDVMVPGRSFVEYNGTTYMVNGTSSSAAYVSGLAASISATTGKPVREVELELRHNLPKP